MTNQWKPNPILYILPITILGALMGYGIKSGFNGFTVISIGVLVWVMGAYIHRFLPDSRRYGEYLTAVYMVCIFVGFAIIIWSLTLLWPPFSPQVVLV